MRAYISPSKCDLDFEKRSILVEVMIFFMQLQQANIHTLECGIGTMPKNRDRLVSTAYPIMVNTMTHYPSNPI